MPKSNSNETPLTADDIAQAQQADPLPWETWNTMRRRLFTWGVPIGWQPERQPEKRVEMGGPGDYITG